ncbi:MAG: copper amine oxidase N-terminal domain-containing protein [Desulfotomaculales bacterium]
MANDSDTLRQAVAELAELSGEEPPQGAIAEITRYDDETIANAMAALRQYAGRNVVGEKRYWRAECGAYPGEHTMDVAPFIENGRTFVPVRYLAYALGLKDKNIGWDGTSKRVTLEWPHYTCLVTLKVGDKTLVKQDGIGNFMTRMDVAPILRNGRVFVPARYVAEAYGYSVQWEQATKTVRVAPPAVIPEPEPQWPGGQKPPPQDPGINGGGIDLSKL